MTENLFLKYFNGHCSQDEKNEILNWIKEESHGLADHLMVQKIWENYSPAEQFDELKYERMLDKVHHLINLSKTEPTAKKRVSFNKMVHSIGKVITRVAAILFIPLFVYFVYSYKKPDPALVKADPPVVDTVEIIAPVGSRTFIRLSDGTGVHLNHGSKLRYPQKFTGEERKVDLEGEAFFSVKHDPERPFLVEASNLLITATGTEFNVMAYPDESFVETTLVEGKVIVQKKNSGNTFLRVCEMKPGSHLKFMQNKNTYHCDSVDPGKYISWKDGVLIFKNDPLQEITSRLGRWYNVEFVFRNESVKEFPYTATFVDETLPQILDLLKLATPIRYEMTSRIKLPDGTFSKPKVFIDIKRN